MALRLPPSFLGKAGVLHPAQNDRLTILSAMFRPAAGQTATNKPLTVTSGAIAGAAGTMGELTLVNPTTVRVNPARFAIQGTQNDLQGAYEVTNDALVDLPVTARHASQYRRSLVAVYVRDSSVAGGASDDAVMTTIDGALSATNGGATVPTVGLPDNLLALGELFIPPTTDAGAVTLTPYNPRTGMRHGILPIVVDGSSTIPGHDLVPGAYVGQYRDHPTTGLQRWDGAAWRDVRGGDWVDLVRNFTFASTVPVTGTPQLVPGTGLSVGPLPPNRTLEVEFHIPRFAPAASTNVYVRLVLNNGVRKGNTYSTNGTTSIGLPLTILESYPTGALGIASCPIQVQWWASGGSCSADADQTQGAPVTLRYRVI